MSKSESRGALKVIALACLIFGMAWLSIGTPFFVRQLNVQRHWLRVNAKLRTSSVVDESGSGGKLYRTHFEFDVKTPSGVRSANVDGYRISSDRSKVEAEAARWHLGTEYLVRANPQDPTEIRLDVDHPLRHFFLPTVFGSIAALFFVSSAALVFFSRR